jgi:predicted extracellular nuclease
MPRVDSNTFRSRSAFQITLVAAVFAASLLVLFTAVQRLLASSPFTPGNLVVYRVGSGSGSLLNTGNPVFLDEYTPAGALVQSIPLPTAVSGSNLRLIASGTATSEGLLTRSADGLYIVLSGYDAPIPTTGLAGTSTTVAPVVLRVVGRVDVAGNIDTSTGLNDWASGNNPRGVASTNGTDLWVGGAAGGVRYTTLGSSTSTQLSTSVTNIRAVGIFAGQLYNSDSSGLTIRLGVVGSGLPTTTGQIINNLPGFPTGGSPYGFFFADLDGTPGVDTLYVADDTNTAGVGGLSKFSLVSGSWVSNGIVGLQGDAYRGLTGVISGNTVTLYATRKGGSGATGGGELVSIVDSSGYKGAFAGTPTLLATAAGSTAFRGVALAPIAIAITQQPVSQTIGFGATATLSVSAAASGTTVSYQWYLGNSGDTSNPISGATNASFTTPSLTLATKYWVRVMSSVGNLNSTTATITVLNAIPPTITLQPVSQLIGIGTTATLTVAATGDAPLSYQWYIGASGVTTNPIVGANAPIFTTPPLFATTSYWARVSNAGGSANSMAAIVSVPACTTPHIAINQVQGSGETSPLLNQTVTVRGVVVGNYEGPAPALRGFYVQDLPADVDADPTTSEGVFVFESDNAIRAALGQVVQVTGKVSEFQGQTEIDAVIPTGVEACGTTAAVVPTDVTLPVPDDVGGVAYLERFEGMLVRFHQTLFVSEHFQLGRFGQIVMSSGGRLPEPTSITLPGPLAVAQENANQLNQIIVDDEQNGQNPDPIEFGRGGNTLTASNTLRGGDTATNIIGVMTFGWAGNSASGNAYRLRPVNALGGGVPNFQPSNPRPAGPPAVGGTLRAVGMNVLNYFLTLDAGGNVCGPVGHTQACRGANTAEERSRQQTKLNQALIKLNADIIGMSELENTDGVDPLLDIVTRLNTSVGPGTYSYVNTGTIGTDDIRVGIIYKPARITPIGAPLVDLNPVHNRPPVAQLFSDNATGERFTAIVNHFRSKGCSTNPPNPLDNDQNDGQGCFNATRVSQSKALLSWIQATVLPAVGDPDVLLVGDYNSYAKEDPIRTIEEAGFINLVSRFSGPNAYSYVFSAEWGYIDHALVSKSMLPQVTGAGDYHINADEPSVLDYNEEFKSAGQIVSLFNSDEFRIADHDPVVIGLTLKASPVAMPDHYVVEAGTTLSVGGTGILSNDTGGPLAFFGHTSPTHGGLSLNATGSFTYTPAAGFFGTDNFSYTVNSASPSYFVQLFSTNLPPLATVGGVSLSAGAFGSAIAPVPGSPDEIYGLTDRGPNVDGPGGTKVEPLPAFTPAIGKFKLTGSQAVLEQVIPLLAPDGTPYSGRVNTQANTGEVITDLNGNILPADPNGYDSEGLVALADGTFWVSDEYGPFITHFDATGRQIARLSPFDDSLPPELAARLANRGMEGLAITPDGTMLVGMMQSALQQTDLLGFDAKKLTPLRIVTYRLADGAVHEYLYLLDDPVSTKTAVSEIAAVSNTTFVVDERDGNFPPNSIKKLYTIDLTGATDIGPSGSVPGTSYDATNGGRLIGGKSIELFLENKNTLDSLTALNGVGITPVSKTLSLDFIGLITSIDAQGRFFGHDKVEGLIALNGGATLVVSNDSDFGIDGLSNSTPPFQLHEKLTPAGVQDDGEFLTVDLVRSTATVTIEVQDTIPPDTAITSMPPSLVNSDSATFAFTGSDSGSGVASFECSLDNAKFTACVTPLTYTDLADGLHSFAVRAIDRAGNVDASPATFAWTVDRTPPNVSASSNTSIVWPPNGKLVPVLVSGRISDGGSGIADGTPAFHVIDEYQTVQPAGAVSLHADGTFSFVMNIEASRLGSDHDGRQYEIIVVAADKAGNTGYASIIIVVPHDQR